MSEELFDDDKFVFSMPIWTIADKALLKTQFGMPHSLTVLDTPECGRILVFFTDEDLARAIIESHPLLDSAQNVPVALHHKALVSSIMEDFRRNGGEYVGIDLSYTPVLRGRFYKINDWLEAFSDPS